MTLAMVLPFSSNTGNEPTVASYFNSRPPTWMLCRTVLSAGNGGSLMSSSFACGSGALQQSGAPPLSGCAASLSAADASGRASVICSKANAKRTAGRRLFINEYMAIDTLCERCGYGLIYVITRCAAKATGTGITENPCCPAKQRRSRISNGGIESVGRSHESPRSILFAACNGHEARRACTHDAQQ